MKATHLLVPMVGATLITMAAEPAMTNSPAAKTNESALSASRDAAVTDKPSPPAPDEQSLQKVGEKAALSGALTKAPPSRARNLGQLLNPFAPVEPSPRTRWVERAAWSTVAETGTAGSTPVEIRHQPQFGISIASH